jgi:hypothetical protein
VKARFHKRLRGNKEYPKGHLSSAGLPARDHRR